VTRLLDGSATQELDLNLPWLDGGGAYFSFTQRVHDYQRRPQVRLTLGKLSAGFYGGSEGAVVDLAACGESAS